MLGERGCCFLHNDSFWNATSAIEECLESLYSYLAGKTKQLGVLHWCLVCVCVCVWGGVGVCVWGGGGGGGGWGGGGVVEID